MSLFAKGLSYSVAGRDLVTDASVSAEPGRTIVLVGPNGAGKSTLLRLLCGDLTPSHGSVRYGDADIATIPPWKLAALRAVLPQASRLAFPFPVADVARIGLDGIGRGLSARDKARILASCLAQADVVHLAARAYQTLSGGEQARVQFARVLCQLTAGRTIAPVQTLFLDEPTASLDLRHQCMILDAARERSRDGTAVVAILHDINLAAAYADEMVVMAEGRIVERGPPSLILTDRLIERVFGVRWPVGTPPPDGQAYILPRRGALASAP